MKRFVWLCILFCVTTAFAQPAVEWTYQFSSLSGRGFAYAWSPTQTQDGGYLVSGDTTRSMAVRLDRDGNAIWIRDFGSQLPTFLTVSTQLVDGGFLLGGSGLVRISAAGDTLWTKPYLRAWNIVPVTDTTFVVGYLTDLAKVTISGTILWSQHYDTPALMMEELDSGRVVEAGDGGFLLTGGVYYPDRSLATGFLIKTDSLGNELWRRSFDFGFSQIIYAAHSLGDGGFILAEDFMPDNPSDPERAFIVRTNSQGDTLWTKLLDDSIMEYPWDIEVTWDEGIVVAGKQYPASGSTINGNITKLSADGDLLWTHDYTGPLVNSYCYVKQTADGGYLLVNDDQPSGPYYQRGIVVKTAPDFPLSHADVTPAYLNYGYVSPGNGFSVPFHLRNTGSTSLRLASVSETANLSIDFRGPVWLEPGTDTTIQVEFRCTSQDPYRDTVWVLCNSNPSAIPVIALANGASAAPEPKPELPLTCKLYDNYPNPFNPTTTISFDLPHVDHVRLAIFDVTGRCVTTLADGALTAGHHSLTFDGRNLSSGVYFYRMETQDFQNCRKMVLLK